MKEENQKKMLKLRKSIVDLKKSFVRGESEIGGFSHNIRSSPGEELMFGKNTENEIHCQIKLYEEEILTLDSCVKFYEQAIRNRNFSVFSKSSSDKRNSKMRPKGSKQRIRELSQENIASYLNSKTLSSSINHKQEKSCLSCSIF